MTTSKLGVLPYVNSPAWVYESGYIILNGYVLGTIEEVYSQLNEELKIIRYVENEKRKK